MKALSLHPYYATLIAAGEKHIEYRSWSTPYRGLLLICASQYNDGPQFPRGYALCIVNLVHITGGNRKYAWHFDPEVVPIAPFPVKGKIHLFDVPDEKITVLYETGTDHFIDFDTAYSLWIDEGICCDVGV